MSELILTEEIPKYSEENCPNATFLTTNLTGADIGLKAGLRCKGR
jgi:hypothetical protein